MAGPWETDRWTCPDGGWLSLRRLPAGGARRGAVLLVHGWGDHAGRMDGTARWLAEHGFDVYGTDQRGHGNTPGRRGHVDRFAQFLADLAALRKLVAAESPGRQFLLGHSYGGFIVLRYLESMPGGLAGAIAVTPFVELARPAARWKVLLARAAVDLIPRLPIPTGLDYDHLAHERAQVIAFRDDPLAHQLMTPRAYVETMAALAALSAEKDRIAVPLLMLLAGDDRIVSTPAAESFARSLRGDVTVQVYPGMFHNVFHEPDRSRVYADLESWLERRLAAGAAA